MTRPDPAAGGRQAWNTDPAPAVEPKVTWASLAAGVGIAAATGVLELVADQPIIVTPLPDWLEPIVIGLVPFALAMVAGYRAHHAPRPDLPLSQR